MIAKAWKKSIVGFVVLLLLAQAGFAWAHGGGDRPEKTGILLVGFGTTFPTARAGFDLVEKKVHTAFPDVEIRWAYTSKIVRNKVEKEENLDWNSVSQALADMMDDDFTQVAILSLHTIPGEEYESMHTVAKAFTGLPKGMHTILVSAPLLSTSQDLDNAAQALLSVLPKDRKPGDAVVLMGHGTHHPGNVYYSAIQYVFGKLDKNVFVGTVEGTPTLDDVMDGLAGSGAKKVYLLPFMAVAGDHANNDMAGDEPDSWKTVLTKAGYEVVPVLKGTSEYEAFVDLWVAHLATVMEHFK